MKAGVVEAPRSAMSDRNVLITSYHFPPDAAVGGIRAARFARHLRRMGWQPVILTATEPNPAQGIDPERLCELESVRVISVPRRPTMRMRLRRLKAAGTTKRSSMPGWIASSWPAAKRHVISLLVFLPDSYKFWSFRASARAIREIRRHRIRLVVTSAPPASTHLVGLAAKLFTNALWIADFRDPWLESLAARPARARARMADAIEARMERVVATRADLVIATTKPIVAALCDRYSGLMPRTPLCVPNAADADQFDPEERAEKFEQFTITYAGSLYEGRTPEPLFKAVHQLLLSGRLARGAFSIKFIGHCEHSDGVPTAELARRYQLADAVELLPAQPRSTVLRIMRRSHLLLVLAPAVQSLIVPAKLFDYLVSGSRVLAIADPGATTDLVNGSAWCVCFPPHDTGGIADYLAEVLAEGTTVQPADRSSFLKAYDAAAVTARLSAAMTDLQKVAYSG